MNEVSFNQVSAQPTARTNTASQGVAAQTGETGKKLPESQVEGKAVPQAEKGVQSQSGQNIGSAIAEVNGFVQALQRDLQFSVDEELDTTVIKVVDSDSGEVIRQIPEDVFLELARNLKQNGELHLVNTKG